MDHAAGKAGRRAPWRVRRDGYGWTGRAAGARHARRPRQSSMPVRCGRLGTLTAAAVAACMSVAVACGQGAAAGDADAIGRAIISSAMGDSSSEDVSRDWDRLHRPEYVGILTRPDIPPHVITDARHDLHAAMKDGSRAYKDSEGKVADEKTRARLHAALTKARGLLTRSSLKSDRKGLDDGGGAIRSAMAAVDGSVKEKRKADEERVRAAIASRRMDQETDGMRAAIDSEMSVPAAPAGDIKAYARQAMGAYGWDDDDGQWDSLDFIVAHESGWNPSAVNGSSGAKGLFQCLGHADCDTPTYMSDYREQVDWGLRYIARRYGDPKAAADYWRSHGSY